MAEGQSVGPPYEGPLATGMVFDYEPGKKHRYERLTITEIKGGNIWARGRSGLTYYEEPEFRRAVVFVAERIVEASPAPVGKPAGRYEGALEKGMVFDYEPGKKNRYERMTISRVQGGNIWAYGRSGETYHDEDEFRDRVVPVEAK